MPVLERLAIIGEMTMAMSRASTAEEVYREALDTIGKVTGSCRAAVLLFDPDGVLRFKAWRGLSDVYRAAVEGHTPWTVGQPLPGPILIPDVGTDTSLGHLRSAVLAEGIEALSFIPLVTGGGTIGKFMVYYDKPHRFDPEEVQLVRNIAAHTSFVIDRQRAVHLLETERRLFSSGPTVMFQWRPGLEWTVEYASPNVLDQWGYPADLLMTGTPTYTSLMHPDDLDRVRNEELEFLAAGKASYAQEYRLRRSDGVYRWVYDFSIPVRSSTGELEHFLGYVLDVTERHDASEALRAAEARLSEAQRLESLGILAGGIAHDFNNLLMGVLGNVSLLLGEMPQGSPLRGTAKDIETAARRAADLTRQLLAYSGKGKFVVELLDLSHLIAESGQLLTAVISKKATLTYRLAPHLPRVEGDATQLRQVIMNLITNASDALGDQPGTIAIATGTERLESSWPAGVIHAGPVSPGVHVYLEVRDTGSGMDDATLQRIFDPFFTTKFHGRGLGLAATLGIMRGHQGAVAVETAPGRGTGFRVYLPAAAEPATVSQPTPVPAFETAAPGGGAMVLVVDDEAVVRDVTRRMLERGGCRVRLAENGRRAIEALEQGRDDIALVILDLTMPELSGEETLALVHERWPDLPVILTTGFSADADTAQLGARGLAGFIQKPYPAGELLSLVRRVLQTAAVR